MVCVIVISVLVLVHAAYAGDGIRIRGVSLTKNSLYNPDRDFTCFDGSKSFQFSLVNDDYCDCTDGSDEPGTSACPNGSFHCPNPGYRPANIPSSRVNDGVCDCCDGSDEWKNTQKCQNTCNELWIAEKQRLAEENEAANIGIKLKEEFSKTGLSKKAERQAKVAELETKLEELSAKEEDLKISKEEIESREATALEEHRQVKEEQRLKEAHEDNLKRGAEAFSEMDSDKDAILVPAELVLHSELDPDTSDSEFTAAEAEVLLQADSVDLNYFLTNVWPMINSTFQTTLSPPVEQQEQESQEVKTEEDLGEDDILRGEVVDEEDYYEDEEETDQEDHQEEEESEEEDEVPPAVPSGEYSAETQQIVDEANSARETFRKHQADKKSVESEIQNLKTALELDFGPDESYQALQFQCYELHTLEYIYKVCPFDRTSQSPKSGGSETNLGRWGRWSGVVEDKYSRMQYDNGLTCWNGPARTTEVRLKCGVDHKLLSVDEPSRCSYVFEFATPCACRPMTHEHPRDEL